MLKTIASALPQTYRHLAPPGMCSSSMASMTLPSPVRSSTQSRMNRITIGSRHEESIGSQTLCLQLFLLLPLLEDLELHLHDLVFGIVRVVDDLHFERIHIAWSGVGAAGAGAGADTVNGKSAVMAGADKLVAFEIHRAAQVRAGGVESLDRAVLLLDEPDASDDIVGMQCPGVAANFSDGRL